jgi:hypothetical protein
MLGLFVACAGRESPRGFISKAGCLEWLCDWLEPIPIVDATFYVPGCRVQLKCDGTHWRTDGDVKGKLANGVGSQYSSHYLGTWCIQHYYRWWRTPRLPVVDWTDAPDVLNGLVLFAERRKLVQAQSN